MKQSKYFSKTSKTTPSDDVSINAKLLTQAGYIQKVMAGVYTFLPLGFRVLTKVEQIIRQEMEKLGAGEVLLPALHPKENWQKSGRWSSLDVLFKLESQHGYAAALGPTHEEIITPTAQSVIQSYRDLPLAVFQIQTKFRDEARAKSGLLRGREFRMKDLYSFHANEDDLEKYYNLVADSYRNIFKKLGLDAVYVEASGGTFSRYSHEFQVEIESGEDTVYVCGGCGLGKNKEIYEEGVLCTDCQSSNFKEIKASEVGNIFQLKTKFSENFDLAYTTEDGSRKLALMGCYGIGPSRIMGVLVEKFHDDKGIVWPESVAPFKVHLVSLPGKDGEAVMQASDRLYLDLLDAGVEVLYDDRMGVSAGEKFADSDLIGIPYRVVISQKTLAENSAEIKKRVDDNAEIIPLDSVISQFTPIHNSKF